MNPKHTLRRNELLKLVPLSDSTIYRLENEGKFPKRFALTPRCVAWDLKEVMDWLGERKKNGASLVTLSPDVRKRKTRPLR